MKTIWPGVKDTNALTLNMPNFINGIIHLPFLAQFILILGVSRLGLEVGQTTV